MPPFNPSLTAELASDGKTFWVNNSAQCLARFSRDGWCIWSAIGDGSPFRDEHDGAVSEIITRSRAGMEMTLADWEQFKGDMETLYGLGNTLGAPPWELKQDCSEGTEVVRPLDPEVLGEVVRRLGRLAEIAKQ